MCVYVCTCVCVHAYILISGTVLWRVSVTENLVEKLMFFAFLWLLSQVPENPLSEFLKKQDEGFYKWNKIKQDHTVSGRVHTSSLSKCDSLRILQPSWFLRVGRGVRSCGGYFHWEPRAAKRPAHAAGKIKSRVLPTSLPTVCLQNQTEESGSNNPLFWTSNTSTARRQHLCLPSDWGSLGTEDLATLWSLEKGQALASLFEGPWLLI